MPFMQNIEEFAHEHPLATVGIGLATVALVFYAMSGNDKSAATTTVVQPDTSADAAGLAAAQVSANAQTAEATIAANAAISQANIAAGVTNGQTEAAAAAATADAASATAIAVSHDQASEIASGNATLSDQFTSLASLLTSYSANQAQEMTSVTQQAAGIINNTTNQQASTAVALGAQAAGVETNTINQLSAIDQAATNGYYNTRQIALMSGYPNVETWQNPMDAGGISNSLETSLYSAMGSNGTGSGGYGGPTVQASADAFNSVINSTAAATGQAGMNDLISSLTAKIGNGVAFHS